MIKFLRIILLCWATAGLSLRSAHAQNAPSEYEVKAAFLYNFIKFVEWPRQSFSEKHTPYIIGVLGKIDPFFDSSALVNYLDQSIQGKTINERPLIIRRSESIADLKDCQLVFITKSERSRWKDIFGTLRGSNILTVSETDDFCTQGGTINFIKQSGKVRFEINPGAAETAGLKISSKLLNVAKIVSTQSR